MANWKVSKEYIELFEHPNADSLEIAKVGDRQYVVRKGIYNTGDIVISIPEKSILPDDLAKDFSNYLAPGNRVKSCKLRGEISEGILIPFVDMPGMQSEIGVDVSDYLDIKEYKPEIPLSLQGTVVTQILPYHKHDCEPLSIYENQISENEEVIISEKIHGSLLSITHNIKNNITELTSKGLGKRGLIIEESKSNIYWQAVYNTELLELIKFIWQNTDSLIQVIAEVVPCQKGFDYGQSEPSLFIYKVIENGSILPYDEIPKELTNLWVPILYRGKYNPDIARKLAQGKTDIYGANHIKEGVVVTPVIPRNSNKGGFDLQLKFISDAYMKQSTGEEFN